MVKNTFISLNVNQIVCLETVRIFAFIYTFICPDLYIHLCAHILLLVGADYCNFPNNFSLTTAVA